MRLRAIAYTRLFKKDPTVLPSDEHVRVKKMLDTNFLLQSWSEDSLNSLFRAFALCSFAYVLTNSITASLCGFSANPRQLRSRSTTNSRQYRSIGRGFAIVLECWPDIRVEYAMGWVGVRGSQSPPGYSPVTPVA